MATDGYTRARDWLVLVAAWPGPGKSTLAEVLVIELGLPLARSLPGRLAEVHCTVPGDLARARYLVRSSGWHAGHLDADRTDDEPWGEPARELGLGPVITADTSAPLTSPARRQPSRPAVLPSGPAAD